MDGVIFDTIPFAQKTFIETHPGLTEEMYQEIHSGNFHEESKKFTHLRIEQSEEEKEKSRIAYSEAKSKSALFPGMKELLQELHDVGVVLILNTGAYTKNTVPLLEHSHLNHLFDFIADAEMSKSKVEKFSVIENKYGLDKKDVLFVTDSLGDLREAEIAQIATVVVTWGVHNRSYFMREPHQFLCGIVDSPAELKAFINSL